MKNFKGDLIGGITASVVSLPLAIAYGTITGLGPAAGIYTTLILGLVATAFGSTSAQISGPMGALTVIVSLVTFREVHIAGDIESALPILTVIFVLAGVIQIIISLLKFGANIRYVPYTVVSGFMSGVGVIIIVLEFPDLFGVYDSPYRTIPDILLHLNYLLVHTDYLNLSLVLATLLIIYLTPFFTKKIPGSLIALLVISLLSYFFKLDVKKIGDINFNLKHLSAFNIYQFFEFATASRILWTSLTMALLASISTLLTSVVADSMTNKTHDSDRELLGQGIGNVLTALVGGFPGSAVSASTVANIKSGGKTKLSGIVSIIVLLIIVLIGMPLAAEIPKPVIAGILIFIGTLLIDRDTMKKINAIPKVDNIVIYLVMILSIFWSLIYAVLIGLTVSAISFMKKMADQVEVDSSKTKFDRIIDQLIGSFKDADEFRKKVLIKTIKGPIFFGFSSRFLHYIKNISPQVETVVFNLSFVPYMDYSGIRTFKEVNLRLAQKNVKTCITEINEDNLKELIAFEIVPQLIPLDHIFRSLEECVTCLHQPEYFNHIHTDNSAIYIPPAFTPNFDGVNDVWRIKNIQRYPDARVQVYTKNDNIVYDSVGYQQPWNGQLHDELLPPGEYRYEITFSQDQEITKRDGSVFIFH